MATDPLAITTRFCIRPTSPWSAFLAAQLIPLLRREAFALLSGVNPPGAAAAGLKHGLSSPQASPATSVAGSVTGGTSVKD